MKFAREVEEPSFQPRAVIAGKDARTRASEILAMSDEEFRAAFKGSAMKRAKVARLRPNSRGILNPAAQYGSTVGRWDRRPSCGGQDGETHDLLWFRD